MTDLITTLEARHSQYVLQGTSQISDDELVDLINRVTVAVPSAFNIQSQRVAVIFGDEHKKLWNGIVKDALHKVAASEEAFAKTSAKIDTFAAAHGTILFFDDMAGTQQLSQQFPLYADTFPIYAEQSLGMLQMAMWAALSERGLGASLQHYNPLIDDAVRKEFKLSPNWRLSAQMPFGDFDIEHPTGTLERMAATDRVKVFGR
ncbi:nitroreductase family protein [Bifidobacterium sp. ESL0790]|uniref:nitroreductase family protein n=1 Tax=Bifidobacterium sp. ESL0790 TaxID=2983233 RepID=UPI0023F88C62|nr:nitroreductase family protein [Bifidobacterium sp. ESL0790]WEV72643.1 nitroreductase family protein [Bifidobacterium sp. ESL0790]